MNNNYITVGALTRYIKYKIDNDVNLQTVYIKGEISNFKHHSRGHFYFTIKDEESRINAIMFASSTKNINFEPVDGMKVLVKGRISVFEQTGNYQIYVTDMTEDGVGNLYALYEKLKKQLGLNDKFVIGHIGRFTFAKNHEFLLDVFKKISDIRNDAVLLLVGDGELNQTIHNSVKTKGLENRVVFAGQVSNPELYYRLANVIVVPSVFEGLSLATIESQIAGVPVVVSDAIPEEAIISNGVVRLSLQSPNWVSTILSMANKIVVLNENSKDYDIYYAVKKLEDWYEDKVKECQMFQ